MYNFQLISADTDSFTICKPTGEVFTKEETDRLTLELNSLYPDNINWEFEFNYPKMLVLKAKNYIMLDNKGNRKVKGSALKSSTLEPVLKLMLNEMIELLLLDEQHKLKAVYQKYVDMVENIQDIRPWSTKKSLSPTTFNSERKNEKDIIDAIRGKEYVSGDRVYLFIKSKVIETGELYKRTGLPKTKKVTYLCLAEDFNGEYCKEHYYKRLEDAIKRFEPVLGKDFFA